MQTADYALAVSLLSFVVSLGSFIWNVWSKFIYPKATLQVSFGLMDVISDEEKYGILMLTAVNHGPSDTTLRTVNCRYRRKWFYFRIKNRWQWSLLMPLHEYPNRRDYTNGPFSGGLPFKLKVGESFSSYFTPDHKYLRDKPIIDLGFFDIFGRFHAAPRASIRQVRKTLQKEHKDKQI